MSDAVASKNDIIEKIGGQSQFDYVLVTFCENIRLDSSLKLYFSHLDLEGLIQLQKDFLDAAASEEEEEEEETMGRLAVKYQLLWRLGMQETHFEKLQNHFILALKECWAEDDVVQMAEQHYNRLRPLFQQQSSKSMPSTQQQSFRSRSSALSSSLHRTSWDTQFRSLL